MIKLTTIVFILATLIGCASRPVDIEPHYSSANAYVVIDCKELYRQADETVMQMNSLEVKLEKLSQDDAAQMAAGLIIFWPMLLFLEGGDGHLAGEYAQLKGEYVAMKKVNISKGCPDKLPKTYTDYQMDGENIIATEDVETWDED